MATDNTHINVLYVDDEENNLSAFKALFRRVFNVSTASSAKEAKKILADNEIHVLITDQRMPETTGTQLLIHAVDNYPDQIRILLTAYSDIEALEELLNHGHIFRYLKKPWDADLLKATIEEAYSIYDLRAKQEELILQLQLTNAKLEQIIKDKINGPDLKP